MSLKVWLPLLGNLDNIGCSNVTVTQYNDPTVNEDGKIGKCYQFSKSSLQKLYIPWGQGQIANNISFSCWVKLLQSATYGTITTAGWTASTYFFAAIYQGEWALGFGDTFYQHSSHTVPIINQWQHVVLTVDNNNKATLYINEIAIEDTTMNQSFNLQSGFYIAGRSTASYYINALMNDIRIYDHCLSKSEIHEIGLGLFAHYKLDDQFINVSNHQWNTNVVVDSSGYGYHGVTVGNVSSITDTPKYSKSLNFDGQRGTYVQLPRDIKTSKDEITIMCWGKIGINPAQFVSTTQNGGWVLRAYSDKMLFETSHGSAHDTYSQAWGPLQSDLTQGWHHFAGTYDGYQSKLYIDGELTGQSEVLEQKEPIFYYKWNYPIIGAESNSSSTPATTPYNEGPISDVRLYSTVLSIEDIQKIYQLGMKVDNKQRIHALETCEDTNITNFSDTRKGQIKSSQIIESGELVKIKNDGSLYADQIIEI